MNDPNFAMFRFDIIKQKKKTKKKLFFANSPFMDGIKNNKFILTLMSIISRNISHISFEFNSFYVNNSDVKKKIFLSMNHSIDDMSQIFKDASENSKMKKRWRKKKNVQWAI